MNIPLLLLVLLSGHVLGDFYFQCNYVAERKKTSIPWLLFHGTVYAACIALSLLALMWFGGVAHSHNLLWIFLLVSGSHLAIDYMKRRATLVRLLNDKNVVCFAKCIKNTRWKKWFFSLDQAAHLIFIFIAWWFWGRGLVIGYYIYDYARHITIALGLLCIIRPVSLLLESGIIWAFDANKLQASQQDASRIIGYLERIVAYFLLLNGEYSAIALVIAAKSIARFPEIKNEDSYMQANHYIIGTFLSLTAVFAVTAMLGL